MTALIGAYNGGGLLGALTYNKTLFLFKQTLHLSAGQISTVQILVNIPAYLQPFLGGFSDLYPLLGYHRRSYYVLAAVVQAAGFWGLAALHAYHYAVIVCLLLIMMAGSILLGVLINAVMVGVGNRTGTFGPLQSLYQFTPLVVSLAYGARLDSQVSQSWTYHHAFLAATLVSLAFLPFVGLIDDRRVTKEDRARETPEERQARQEERERNALALRGTLMTPGTWAMVGFLFYLYVTPLLLTASVFYEQDVLHLSNGFIGSLDFYVSLGAITALVVFGGASRRMPVRALVWGAIASDALIYLCAMTIHNAPSARLGQFLWNFMATFLAVCLNTLAARACPPQLEGTIYGLMQSALALSLQLCDKFGSGLYDYFGPAHGHSITHGWFCALWAGLGFTVLAVFFVPFLPAWAKSGLPLKVSEVESAA